MTSARSAALATGACDPTSAVLELTEISKAFGSVRALTDASLRLPAAGRVHALLGSNGSGKSTLLGILSGQLSPDAGTLTLDGHPASFASPSDAVRAGIVMVSQETSVAPDLSVTENVLLGGRHARTVLGIDWRASRHRAVRVLEMLGVDCSPDETVRGLRADQRQMVEIARALSMDARVVILDEPTSSLTEREVESLFGVVRRLTTTGVSVIFVSHLLGEVESIADDITILRDGRTVATGVATGFTRERIVSEMVGEVQLRPTRRSRSAASLNQVRLAVSELSVPGALDKVTFSAAAGEIVGLAGLEGAGCSELLEVIFGLRNHQEGTVVVDSRNLEGSERRAMDHGIGYLPPDRKSQGVVLTMSIADNVSMVTMRNVARLRSPTRRGTSHEIDDAMDRLSIRAPSRDTLVGNLSGGNQQKVALAKWLTVRLSVLLLDEPTRGVDIAAKADIHVEIDDLAATGVAVIISSSEYDELLVLCDRILVMARGRIVASLPASETTEADISRYASAA